MDSIGGIYNKDGEITIIPRRHDDTDDRKRRATYDRNVCVHGNIQRRSTSSVVVTDKHVRQRLNSCPPRSAYIKDAVQRLKKRADILLMNEAGESNTTEGRAFCVEVCTWSRDNELPASSNSLIWEDDSAGAVRSWYSSCNGSGR